MSSEFIRMIADASERRLLRTIESLSAKKISCGFFFAPRIPDDAQQLVDSFKNSGVDIKCVCLLVDEQKNFFRDAEQLITVEKFPSLPEKPKIILTMSAFGLAFKDYFKRYGADTILFSDLAAAEDKFNFYMKHLPELYDVHEMLADDESKKIFRAAITGRITQNVNDFIFAEEYQYFLNGFLPTTGDIAIDGGCYDGDTAADFVRQGAKVFAFEMDANNFRNCIAPAKKFGFTLENLGLSEHIGEANYSSTGEDSHIIENGSGTGVAQFVDLDTYVEQKDIPRVDYIKLDIEGLELAALRGAAKTITRCKPKMAICVYHRPEDLWTLPKLIKTLRPDYEFQFRHHTFDRKKYVYGQTYWEFLKYLNLSYRTPSDTDMVLYCR